MANPLSISMVVGDTHTVQFTVSSVGSALVLTGATGALDIWSSDGTSLATISGVDISPTEMKYVFGPSDTADIEPGTYPYSAKVTLVDGSVYTIAINTIVLRPFKRG